MKSEQSLPCKRRLFPKNWRPFLLLLFLSLSLLSCSGGGIGGSGVVTADTSSNGDIGMTSIGPITALGSISVNGIEFETTGETVTTAGVNSDVLGLRVGMVVKVEGTLHADGKTGHADVVAYAPNAEGPITAIDLGKSSLEVMGQTVLVDAQTILAGLPGNTPGLADLAADDLVEISGLTDPEGNIMATRITRKAAVGQPEVTGRISSLTVANFKVNGLTVDFGNAALSKFGSSGIQLGDFVAVKGDLASPTTLLADAVEKKSPDFKEGYIEIEGFIDSLLYAGQSINGFAIITPFGLQEVELTTSTVFSGGELAQVKAGTRVRVEGAILNRILRGTRLMLF